MTRSGARQARAPKRGGMPTRRVLILAALLAVGMASATQAAAAGVDGVPRFGHVFLIVGENTSFRQVSPETRRISRAP